MSILAWIEDQRKLKLLNAPKYNHPTSDGSQGLWTRCDHCGVILYIKHLKENQRVCFGCGYHLQMNSQERIEHLIDLGSWRPLDETISPCDPLEFRDQKNYTERLKEAQERTGLQDAIQTGTGMLDGIPIALGVMDFNFMGGSMGSVVGEKITRLIEYATQEGLTLVLVCASGGARMQEGILSLMQMAKISAALQVYQSSANLLYISVLTSPTTGGVTASFAMLGDLIFAEPKALIGFAGRRVIEQTLQEQLPDDFQTAEYLLHHGLLDLIVPRSFLKQALSETITLYKDAPFKRPGIIPHGIQKNISFVSEEKVRRKWNNWITQSKTSPSFSASSASLEQDASDQKEEQETLYSAFKEPLSDLSYRDFLMSFQTMFDLFSVDPNSLTSPKVIPQHRLLLTSPKEMLEANPKEYQVQAQEGDISSTEKNSLISSTNVLEDSISIAKNEIIEWRASYVTQNLEPKINFLKDFSEQFKEKNKMSSKTDKKFFYRTVLLPTD
ncbi:MAG: acetyl-CoA carboxylase carboxyltransferase subunit beta [Cyanobacteriota bacterium]|nr:MAG: acetyl-CoA carboxylase carboxyltransferase subunit beta [Cyanobacteriota bacterium]